MRTVAALIDHSLAFLVPAAALSFLATAPHPWWATLPWIAVIACAVWMDHRSRPEHAQPAPMAGWPFDAMLVVLAALQLLNVLLLARMVANGGFLRLDTLVGVVLVGTSSGYSAIVVAHELVHRTPGLHKTLGRVLLVTVLYEHFFTEHVRGHHLRIGTPEDPATARFGEPFWVFYRRTVPAQFRSAWALETRRVGGGIGVLRNRVLHGVVAGIGLSVVIGLWAGPGPLVAFLAQAWIASLLLEAVNWFEHWGLVREPGARVTTAHSWDADSRVTLFALVGLSRHADHHALASRPFPELRWHEGSPKLPTGYFGMVVLALFADHRVRPLMVDELVRRGLAPVGHRDAAPDAAITG
jgi:alkane 1-monooxygenase